MRNAPISDSKFLACISFLVCCTMRGNSRSNHCNSAWPLGNGTQRHFFVDLFFGLCLGSPLIPKIILAISGNFC